MSRTIDKFFNNLHKEGIHILHPLQSFFIEINSTCNLKCTHCYIPNSLKENTLPLKDITNIIKTISNEWSNSVLIAITGGEPLLHPDFKEICNTLHKYGFKWTLATNGLLLRKEIIVELKKNNCTTIAISLDGNQKTHELQRNKEGIYQKTLNSIDMLIEQSFPNIYVTSTIHNENVESLNDIYSLISKYQNKVKWRINPLLSCTNVQENNLNISKETYNEIGEFYTKVNKELGIKIILGEKSPLALKYKEYIYSSFDSCFAGISTFGVLSNGDIVNCMVCRDEVLGNISQPNSLKSVWDNQDLKKKGLCKRHFVN